MVSLFKVNEIGNEDLIDWFRINESDCQRWRYIEVLSDNFLQSGEKKIIPKVVLYAYNKGIFFPVQMCQSYFYVGIENTGSIVCPTCLVGARYGAFGISEKAFIVNFHVHAHSLAVCLYCRKRISSTRLNKCSLNPNCQSLLELSKFSQCKRIN